MDEEAPGPDRFQPCLAERQPVGVAELLDLWRPPGAWRQRGDRRQIGLAGLGLEIAVEPPAPAVLLARYQGRRLV
jgi:hypothetical protein